MTASFTTSLSGRTGARADAWRCSLTLLALLAVDPGFAVEPLPHTRIVLRDGHWMINDRLPHPGSATEGLLMNVRMVNATFEDRAKPDFDPEANTDQFIARIRDYAAQGVNAFTLCLQGGMPGYEGAVNSAFEPDGRLREAYLKRVERVIRVCDQHGLGVILGLYYQRQSAILRDEAAVRAGVVNAVRWVRGRGFQNVMIEIANEYPHKGFAHALIRDPGGQPILPIGDSVTHGWMEQGTDFDQRAYLDALAAQGLNAVLLWSYTATSAAAQRADRRVGYDSPEIWPWQGSPAVSGGTASVQFQPPFAGDAVLHLVGRASESQLTNP